MKPASGTHNATTRIELTRAQELIRAGQRFNPAAPLYNMAMDFPLGRGLDPRRFERAFIGLCRGEPMMRATLDTAGGSAALEVPPPGAGPALEIHDAPAGGIAAAVASYVFRPFADGETLTRSALLRDADGKWTWLLVQHHLVSDVGSFFVLHERLAAIYQTAAGGTVPGGPEADWPAFAEYAARERTLRDDPGIDALRNRLVEETRDCGPGVRFYPRFADVPAWRNRRLERALAPAHWPQRMRDESPGAELGRMLWLLSVLCALLHRLGGVGKPVVGVPLHNRTSRRRRDTAGLLMEMAPVAVEVDAGASMSALFEALSTRFREIVAQGTIGIADRRTAARFDAVLNYIVVPALQFGEDEARPRWIHCNAADPNHALRIHAWRRADATSLVFDCREDTFDAARQEEFCAVFRHVMRQAAMDPDRPIRELELLDRERRRTVMARAAGPVEPAPAQTLIERIRAQCARRPAQTALIEHRQALSYAELDARADRVAAGLARLGLGPGNAVMVLHPRSLEAVVAILGIMKAGAAFVPVDPVTPPERLRGIVRDLDDGSGGVPVLAPGESTAGIDAMGGRVIEPDHPEPAPPARAPVVDEDCCYVLYTSGSTGTPKGVMISSASIQDYIDWSARAYAPTQADRFGLFTPLSFDLTLTCLFLPLVCGASLRIYPANAGPVDMAIADVVRDNELTFAKLTPSHLSFWSRESLRGSRIRTWVIGGEDLKTELARRITRDNPQRRVYNEYGPTEATVGCTIHRFDPESDTGGSVPIGVPRANHSILVLDAHGEHVPDEVTGEICIAGAGVARGYLNRPGETDSRFVPAGPGPGRIYRSGDLGRWNRRGLLEYLGRADRQVKLSGIRLELEEIDNLLLAHPGVTNAVTGLVDRQASGAVGPGRCMRCGIEDSYPGIDFDDHGVCSICRRFEAVKPRVMQWFRSEADFARLAERMKAQASSAHHCAVLFSGGKDSTYMLYQLAGFGLNPVALTLDNGFISKQAKDNIRRAVDDLGLDHEYLSTPHMNRIFSASLNEFNNVCNGCFKTIYTLSTQYALEHDIGWVITGLSRGQLFETRLHDLFDRDDVPVEQYDDLILKARKAYHRRDDEVARCLDTSPFAEDATFARVRFLDFYRYFDVPLDRVYEFLRTQAPWTRPDDTGRSTNCLINDTGILVHKRRAGYHNYALAYSWDVRLGHKSREQALAELDDRIDEAEVARNLAQVGHDRPLPGGRTLTSVVAGDDLDPEALRQWLRDRLPAGVMPQRILVRDRLPLGAHGKVDFTQLKDEPGAVQAVSHAEPRGEPEQALARCWRRVLGPSAAVSRHSEFFALGGESMTVILLVEDLAAESLTLDPADVFAHPVLHDMATRLRPWSGDSAPAEEDEEFGLDISAEERRAIDKRFRGSSP